jgi:preprotein translocase subunit SecG
MITLPLVGAIIQTVFGVLMFLAALFLILLVLVQRGRGGGLSGALGGMGGQSAFGTRAGDTFTYVTIWASAAWILLCIAAVKFLGFQPGKLGAEAAGASRAAETAPLDGATQPPAEGETGPATSTVPSGTGAEPSSGSGAGGATEAGADEGGAASAEGSGSNTPESP